MMMMMMMMMMDGVNWELPVGGKAKLSEAAERGDVARQTTEPVVAHLQRLQSAQLAHAVRQRVEPAVKRYR